MPHGSDAQFLFTNKMATELNLTVTLSDDDVKIRDFYLDVFTSFAKNGLVLTSILLIFNTKLRICL